MSNTISFNPRDPNSLLNMISLRESARYNEDYVPVEDAAIASLNDTSIVKRSKDSAARSFGNANAQFSRNLSRYGVKQGAADQQTQQLRFRMGESLAGADTVNNARLTQFDRNRTMANDLINIGRGVAGDAMNNVSSAATLQVNRENADRANAASNKAGLLKLGGTIGSAALYAMMV